MRCPNCDETLLMSDREGIEIDYCPSCRGVWLDRGELDKIIERTVGDRRSTSDPRPYDREHDRRYGKKPKRKHLLEELFDFG